MRHLRRGGHGGTRVHTSETARFYDIPKYGIFQGRDKMIQVHWKTGFVKIRVDRLREDELMVCDVM